MKVSLILVLLTITTIITIAYAVEADIIKYDHLHIVTEFNYTIESSISRFNDILTLMTTFIITIYEQDYQLAKYKDYTYMLAEFIYTLTDPNTITTITETTSMNIANEFSVREQESITATRYSLLDISISVDITVVEGGDNQWN